MDTRFFPVCHTTHHHTHRTPHHNNTQQHNTRRQTDRDRGKQEEGKTRDERRQDERQGKARRETREEKRRDKMKGNRREIRLWLSGFFLFNITRPSNNFEFSKFPVRLPTPNTIFFPVIFCSCDYILKLFGNHFGNHFGTHGTRGFTARGQNYEESSRIWRPARRATHQEK